MYLELFCGKELSAAISFNDYKLRGKISEA